MMYRFIDLNGKVTDQDAVLREGLLASPKFIPSCFIYDTAGHRFFEKICELPEYYLTRKEVEILKTNTDEITYLIGTDRIIVELGSGNSLKTRLIIESCLERQASVCYVPVDISGQVLAETSHRLCRDYPELSVTACCGDYFDSLDYLQGIPGKKLVLWLGSSIGNFDKPDAAHFLRHVKNRLNPGDAMLIGIDLRKDAEILEDAYNDSCGITSRYHLNCLDRFNTEYGANFHKDRFYHRSEYNEATGNINAYIISKCRQTIDLMDFGFSIYLEKEEKIFNERSCKYSLSEIDQLAKKSGLNILARWMDKAKYYSLNLFVAA